MHHPIANIPRDGSGIEVLNSFFGKITFLFAIHIVALPILQQQNMHSGVHVHAVHETSTGSEVRTVAVVAGGGGEGGRGGGGGEGGGEGEQVYRVEHLHAWVRADEGEGEGEGEGEEEEGEAAPTAPLTLSRALTDASELPPQHVAHGVAFEHTDMLAIVRSDRVHTLIAVFAFLAGTTDCLCYLCCLCVPCADGMSSGLRVRAADQAELQFMKG